MNGQTLEYAQAALTDLRAFLSREVTPRGEPRNPLRSFDEIRDDYQYRRAEGHWFDRDSMRFFATREASGVVYVPALGVTIFVTSEQDKYAGGARRFTLRAYRWADADITTLGPFCEMTQARVKAALQWLHEQLA